MTNTGQVCKALVVESLLDSIRRKDLYVVAILTAVMVTASYSFEFFGVHGLATFVRDMAFTCVGLFSTILGVIITARQIPEQVQRRTIYPLLARPITRWQLVLGKFAAAWVASVTTFLLLLTVACLLLIVLHVPIKPIFFQYVLLRCLGFGWLAGFVLFLSCIMSQSGAVTVGILLALGSGLITRAFVMFYNPNQILNPIINLFYGLMPQYSMFDITRKVVYDWAPIPRLTVFFLFAYATPISLFWVYLAWRRFRAQAV